MPGGRAEAGAVRVWEAAEVQAEAQQSSVQGRWPRECGDGRIRGQGTRSRAKKQSGERTRGEGERPTDPWITGKL